jgi:hypothetical protein
MIIVFDTVKREKTLLERGLDLLIPTRFLMAFTLSLAMIVLTTARSVSSPLGYWMVGWL